jgi:hypothetical protein
MRIAHIRHIQMVWINISRGLAMKFAKQALVATLIGIASLSAQAESDINLATTNPASANARLDFRVVVPRVLFLRVGTGANFADALGGTNIDRVDFNVPDVDVANNVTIAGQAGQGPYGVAARVFSNGGSVNFSAAGSLGGLISGARSIAWSRITPVTAGALTHPTIDAAPATLAASAAGVVNQAATWTFNYGHQDTVGAGTYNGQVTYTATLP